MVKNVCRLTDILLKRESSRYGFGSAPVWIMFSLELLTCPSQFHHALDPGPGARDTGQCSAWSACVSRSPTLTRIHHRNES